MLDVFKIVKKLTQLQELRVKEFSSTSFPEDMSLSRMSSTYKSANPNLRIFYVNTCKLPSKDGGCLVLVDIATSKKWLAKEWIKLMEDGQFVVYRERLQQVQFPIKLKLHL